MTNKLKPGTLLKIIVSPNRCWEKEDGVVGHRWLDNKITETIGVQIDFIVLLITDCSKYMRIPDFVEVLYKKEKISIAKENLELANNDTRRNTRSQTRNAFTCNQKKPQKK